MIKMVCPRDYTLRTLHGHVIHFEAGVPTPVPESAYQEALAKNILPVKAPDGETAAFEMASAEITGSLRDALIFDAIRVIVTRNHTEDFTGGGVPKAAVIAAETGIAVGAPEMSRYWTRYKEIVANNDELPSHPNVELVRELQGLSTRKQLEAFAKDIGADLPNTKGKSLSELKAQLLYTVVNTQNAPLLDPEDKPYAKPAGLTMD